ATALGSTFAYGGSFGENLLNAGMNAGFDKLGEGFAGHIGKQKLDGALSEFQGELAHGAVGCGLGMVRTASSKGCAAGAAGAVTAHLTAGAIDRQTGYTMSDQDLKFWSGVAGGVASAATGDGRQAQANYGLGTALGESAVGNNYLTGRSVKAALDLVERNCKTNCDSLLRSIETSSARKGADLEQRCQVHPEKCSGEIKDTAEGLRELYSDRAAKVFADRPEVLAGLQRQQVRDLGRAIEGLDYASENAESLERVRTTVSALAVGAGGGALLGLAARALVLACASGVGSASCVAASTELAVGAMETAGGVPTVGLTAASAAGVAQRLAQTANRSSDLTQVVHEARSIRAEIEVLTSHDLGPKENLARVLHRVELGKDPAKGGKFVVDEAITGARIEQQMGLKLKRDPSGDGDWISSRGEVLDGASPPPGKYFSDKSFAQWQSSIRSHLNKQGVDVIVVDPVQRGLSASQIEAVKSYIGGLSEAEQSRILILE
ncbi:hypothetical protein, partial [Hydrogenophaga sp. 5NK40-0174]|uniref:hypothetical protein n=1 Tax=Hydrogenophaga sp. 5NK40-0174 TaxID=3127649 RepID=UPI003341E661